MHCYDTCNAPEVVFAIYTQFFHVETGEKSDKSGGEIREQFNILFGERDVKFCNTK